MAPIVGYFFSLVWCFVVFVGVTAVDVYVPGCRTDLIWTGPCQQYCRCIAPDVGMCDSACNLTQLQLASPTFKSAGSVLTQVDGRPPLPLAGAQSLSKGGAIWVPPALPVPPKNST